MKRIRWISAAFAASLLLVGQAKADFNYATAITPSPPGNAPLTFGSASSVQYNSVAPPNTQSTALGSVGISIAQVSVSDARATAGTDGPISLSITDTITIMPTTGGSGTLSVVGTINVITGTTVTGGVPTYAQVSSFTPTGGVFSVLINGVTYNLSNIQYSQPTVNVANSGGLSVTITPVPEPASMALVGVGGLLLAAPRLRRLVRRIARSEQG